MIFPGASVVAIALMLMALAATAVPARADWQAPFDLSPVGSPEGPPCETGRPSVAAARDGSFLVAWQRKLDDQSDENTVIEARRIGPDGTPGPLLRLSDTPGNLGSVEAAVGRDGAGVVIWHRLPGGACGRTEGPITLVARRVGADGDMGPLIPVSEPSDKSLTAAVVMHRSGDATVAWVDQLALAQSQLKVRRLPAEGAPGPVWPLTPTLGQAQEVKLVVDQRNRTLVVWNQHGQLQAQRLSPAGEPLPGVIDVTSEDDTSAELDLGIAASGEARVSWVRFSPEPIAVLTRTIAPDGALGPIDEIASGEDRPVGARVAVNASGAAALVWFTSPPSAGASDFVFGRTISPAGRLAPAVTLSGPGQPVDMTPSVTLANNGAALATWQRNLGGTGVVEAARFSAAGAEGAATPLSQASPYLLSPDLAGNPRGDALAAWGQGTDDDDGVRIQAARFCRRPGKLHPRRPPCRRTGRPPSPPGASNARNR
jgi:hypothetical protein